MTRPLTMRQKATLNYVIRYKRENGGDSPTVREIMRGVGLSSTSVVHYQLVALETRGLISREAGGGTRFSRIAVTGGRWVDGGGCVNREMAATMADMVKRLYAAYLERGYHTFAYWIGHTPEGEAALLGELESIIEDTWPEEYRAAWKPYENNETVLSRDPRPITEAS